MPRMLFTTRVASASPSTSSAMIQQLLTGLDHLVDDGKQILDVGDLAVDDQDVRVFEDRLLALGVGDEVGGQEALVEAHALGELQLRAEGVGLLDRDHALLAHLVDGLGDQRADLGVTGGDGCGGCDFLLGLDLLGAGVPGFARRSSTRAPAVWIPVDDPGSRRTVTLYWAADSHLSAAARLMRTTITDWNWMPTEPHRM